MRLSLLLLFVMVTQASASALGQSVTLKAKNASLTSIFKEIRQQTGYDFFFNKELLQKAKPVTIDVKNASIDQVLEQILQGQPLSFKLENKVVMLREKITSFIPGFSAPAAAPITVEGRVIDSTGVALIGASVRTKPGKVSTITDPTGRFKLENIDDGSTLEVSYVGYISREVRFTRETAGNLNIVLIKDINKLQEVSIVSNGYQTISRERSAGSYATADMDIVRSRSTSMNVLQSLDGLIPGMVVNNAPNRNPYIIRGLATTGAPSPTGNTGYTGSSPQPLIVVDGMVMPDATGDNPLASPGIAGINPQDVESVTVLKDATAASIWGARAANGVIVITTKKGSFNSKLRVNYDGFTNFRGKPDFGYTPRMNSRQFVETASQLFNMPGFQAGYPWNVVSNLNGGGIMPHDLIMYNQTRGIISADQAAKSLDSLAGIDNSGQISDLFYRNSMLSNHTISMSGGSERYSFYGSASYTNNKSDQPGESNQTYKLNLRQDIRAAKFLRFHILTDLSTNDARSKRNFEVDNSFLPYQLFRDGNGNNLDLRFLQNQSDSILNDIQARSRISMAYSPLDEFNRGYTRSNALMARINTGVSIDLYKGLRFEGKYGYMKGNNKSREFESLQSFAVRKEIAAFAVAPNAATVPKYYLPTNGGRLTSMAGDQRNWTVSNQLFYDNSFGKHEINALLGQESQEQFSTSTMTRVRGFDEDLQTWGPVDYVALSGLVQGTVWPNYGAFGSTMQPDNFSVNETTVRFTSYYANVGYTFDRRYSLNASWRNDQSNLFGKDKAAQNKPIWSVGGKWNIGAESFMGQVNWLNQLALRATYGLTGNSPNPGVAASYDITRPLGSAFFPGNVGMIVATPGNDKLSWESTRTTNFGLDFSVLKSRISGTVDFYLRKTDNLLGLVYPNSLTGWPAIVGNQGSISNRGIEVSLQTQNVRAKDFSWNTSWIFAHNKNMIDELTTGVPFTTGAQQVMAVYRMGYPAYTRFAYKYGGLDNTGAPLVVLKDGTTMKNRVGTTPDDVVFMGTFQPIWNGGINNVFRYKDFRLASNMVYNMGHVMTRPRYLTFGGPLRSNISPEFLDRWQQPGDELKTDIPGYITNGNPNAGVIDIDYFYKGDINVVDASFLKLRDVTLFYDLPKNLLSHVKIQGVTFRAQVSNVLLWKANKFGLDPELEGIVAPTNQKTFTIGAHLTL